MPRPYRLGRRQAAVDRTSHAILEAARALLAEQGPETPVGAIADRAGVSRLTVYGRFGSRAGLLAAIGSAPAAHGSLDLRGHLERSCDAWAENPALYRNLRVEAAGDVPRRIAEELSASDGLRPGCSLKEAEDVIAALSSFAVFDRLHKDGRRSTAAVTDILMRLAAGILA